MKKDARPKTKVLFVDQDERLFQIGQCIAKVLNQLPPMELFHANDATEALGLLESVKPDVVILDDDTPEELDLFIESLAAGSRPRIVVQSHGTAGKSGVNPDIVRVPKSESLEEISQVLFLAASIAGKSPSTGTHSFH